VEHLGRPTVEGSRAVGPKSQLREFSRIKNIKQDNLRLSECWKVPSSSKFSELLPATKEKGDISI